jgi:hypothetical protein
MDESMLVVMGKNQDYRILKEEKQKVITSKDTFLEGLLLESLPAAELQHFGGPMHINALCERGEAQPEAVAALFRKIKEYARGYGVPYAMLYNFDLSKTSEVSADVQLLIKTMR